MTLPSKNVDSTVRQRLGTDQQNLQGQNLPHYTRAPLVTEIPDQGHVLATIGGTLYLYTKVGGKLFKTPYTAA